MSKYDISIKANTWYCSVEAENEREAVEKALDEFIEKVLEWFIEHEPETPAEPVEEPEDEDEWKCCRCKCIDMDTEDKIYCCNNCRDYDHFIPADEEMEICWDERYIPSIFELNP